MIGLDRVGLGSRSRAVEFPVPDLFERTVHGRNCPCGVSASVELSVSRKNCPRFHGPDQGECGGSISFSI